MAIFDKNILREEESGSGFQPGTQDDDSFQLETMEEYPGDLKRFGIVYKEEVLPEFEPVGAGVEDIPFDDAFGDENVLAQEFPAFDDTDSPPYIAPEEPLYDDEETFQDAPKEDEGSVWDLFEDDEQAPVLDEFPDEETEPYREDLSQLDDLGDLLAEEIPESTKVIEKSPKKPTPKDEPVQSLDEELKRLLEEEIERGKKIREEKLRENENKGAEQEDDYYDEDMGGGLDIGLSGDKIISRKKTTKEKKTEKEEIFDFSEIEADKPSTYGLKQFPDDDEDDEFPKMMVEPPAAAATEKTGKVRIEKPIKPVKIKPPKVKKPREPLPWDKITTIAAAVLLFGAILLFAIHQTEAIVSTAGVMYQNIEHLFDTHEPPVEKHKETAKEKKEEPEQHSEAAETKTEDVHTTEPQPAMTGTKPVIHEEAEKETAHSVAIPTPHPVYTEEIHTKPKISTQPEKSIIHEIPNKKVVIKPKNIKRNTKEEKFSFNIPEEGEYAVQIYSTPIRSDAEDWLDLLHRKNIREAFISTQTIRDKVWYRVRFGTYRTRDEARQAALSNGFPQSWVDRIR
ncbi:MAG: hypothetical protein QG635_625 [Bacteroidota bacterium]|nr:hypothetical protein [Bacteroidota bacterium]